MSTTPTQNEVLINPTPDHFGEYYLLEKEIGRSQAASLYRAREQGNGRILAVKIFRRSFSADPRFVIRFREQMKEILVVQNKYLVSTIDYGVINGRFYIATEWVDGIDLGAFLAEHGPLSAPQATAVASEICSALKALHGYGLVHHNLKSANILLSRQGRVKVTDAGLSSLISESGLSRTHVMIGRFNYIAPEQVRGKAAGPESDLYSLGILLYEMLTNHPPFESRDAWQVLHMHIDANSISDEDFPPQIPLPLRAIVLRALQKEPSLRFTSAGEMGMALNELLPHNSSSQLVPSLDPNSKQPGDRSLAYRFLQI